MIERFSVSVLPCAALLLIGAGRAHAGTFDVSPLALTLSDKVGSGMLAVSNRGAEPVRFQISAVAWDEKPSGEMALEPTTDIVFFPSMLTLNAKETRNLRIGAKVKPGAIEKTYRIFVQELPPLAQTAADEAGVVRMLTKMGIPIFVEATAPKAKPVVADLALAGGKFTFNVKNAGNAHFRSETIAVKAKDGAKKVIHVEELKGWYVLAGKMRSYAVTLPAQACKTLKSVDVELRSNKGSFSASLANARCGP